MFEFFLVQVSRPLGRHQCCAEVLVYFADAEGGLGRDIGYLVGGRLGVTLDGGFHVFFLSHQVFLEWFLEGNLVVGGLLACNQRKACVRGQVTGTVGALFAGSTIRLDQLALPVQRLACLSGLVIKLDQLELRFHGRFDGLRKFLDETLVGLDSLVTAPGLLVQAGGSQACLATQGRVFFTAGDALELTRGADRLSVFAVEHGEFARDIGLQFVPWICLAPRFENADRIRPVFQRYIGRCRIVLGCYVDGGAGDNGCNPEEVAGGISQVTTGPGQLALLVNAGGEFFL